MMLTGHGQLHEDLFFRPVQRRGKDSGKGGRLTEIDILRRDRAVRSEAVKHGPKRLVLREFTQERLVAV